MTDDQGGRRDVGPVQNVGPVATPGITWPIVAIAALLLASLVTIIVTGHDVDDLVRGLAALFSATGALAGIGAWYRSTQAAKQTNGIMDQRIAEGVQAGITAALAEARNASAPQAAAPARSAARAARARPTHVQPHEQTQPLQQPPAA